MKNEKDSHAHVLECSALLQNINMVTNSQVELSQIFDSNVEKQLEVTRLFQHFWNIKKKIIDRQ